MPDTPPLPQFVNWPSFPFEGQLRTKHLDAPVPVEPPREGEDPNTCTACKAPDDRYVWVSDRWRVRAMERPSGLPMVLILESRSHLDLGDLPNLHAAELGVMTVRIERAIRSIDGVERVHVNRWGDGAAHFHQWFLGRPTGYLQLRGSFLSQWDDILEPIPEGRWRENLAHVAAWLADFGGRAIAEPPRIEWHAPSRFGDVQADIAVPADGSVAVGVAAVVAPADGTRVDVESADSATTSGEGTDGRAAEPVEAGSEATDGATTNNQANKDVTAKAGGATADGVAHTDGAAEADTAAKADGGAHTYGTAVPNPAAEANGDTAPETAGNPTAAQAKTTPSAGGGPVLTVQPAATARGTASVVQQRVPEQSSGDAEPDWTISDEELESSDILAH